jgi:LysR family nitrogen assimilation transcriptional regulator
MNPIQNYLTNISYSSPSTISTTNQLLCGNLHIRKHTMEFLQLQYFVRVAEQGSFTNAALQLGVAQPALSRKVRALEVELRTNLFHRNGRGAQLTSAGRRFLDHARGLLHGADSAMQAVREGAASYEGRVAVGLTPNVGKILIPTFVEEFVGKFPKASISIVEGLSVSLGNQLLAGRLDFAILRNPVASPHLSIEPITTEALFLVGVKPAGTGGDSVTLADLAGLPLITPSAPHTFRPLIEAAMQRMGNTLNITIEIDSVSSIMELAAKGLGYILIPESTVPMVPAGSNLCCQKIVAPELFTTLCMVTPSRQPQTPLPLEAAHLAHEILLRMLGLALPQKYPDADRKADATISAVPI